VRTAWTCRTRSTRAPRCGAPIASNARLIESRIPPCVAGAVDRISDPVWSTELPSFRESAIVGGGAAPGLAREARSPRPATESPQNDFDVMHGRPFSF
jgi:hypothetical protein